MKIVHFLRCSISSSSHYAGSSSSKNKSGRKEFGQRFASPIISCKYCKKEGHVIRKCPIVRCDRCHVQGHIRIDCNQRLDHTTKFSLDTSRRGVTHFICLFLSSDSMKADHVQNELISIFKLPDTLRVNVLQDFHVTLLTLSIQTEQQVEFVQTSLKKWQRLLPGKLSVKINETGLFRDSVLYAKPQFLVRSQVEQLLTWRNQMLIDLKEIEYSNRHPWIPHATLLKTRSGATTILTEHLKIKAQELWNEK